MLGRRLDGRRLEEAPRALITTSFSVGRNGRCRLSPDLWGAKTGVTPVTCRQARV